MVEDEPPPSYSEAVADAANEASGYNRPGVVLPGNAPSLPNRPRPNPPSRPTLTYQSPRPNSSGPTHSSAPGPRPGTQTNPAFYGHSVAGSSSDIYTNNPQLPFRYSAGYFCPKCKNSGFKVRNGRACVDCWARFYLRDHAYNPNPNLPFQYPRGYLCDRCNNTGVKVKNGLGCQYCYEQFAPRNNVSYLYTQGPLLLDLFFGPSARWTGANMMPGGAPVSVAPGDPRLGGHLCGRCRGSGQIRFFLDYDLCNVCGGTGRVGRG